MDPNLVLDELRSLVASNARWRGVATGQEDEFADLFESLDEWLSSGGFLPKAWASTGRFVYGEGAHSGLG